MTTYAQWNGLPLLMLCKEVKTDQGGTHAVSTTYVWYVSREVKNDSGKQKFLFNSKCAINMKTLRIAALDCSSVGDCSCWYFTQ